MDFHVCVSARARCEYRCMCVLVSAGGVEWTSGSPREALAERAAGGACARPDPARTDRGPACPFPRAPAVSRTLRGLVWARSARRPHARAARRVCWGSCGRRAGLSGTYLECLRAVVLCRPPARADGSGWAPRSSFWATRSSWAFLLTARAMRAGRGSRVTERSPFRAC